MTTSFRVSDDYIEWAHSSAAEDGHSLAIQLIDIPTRKAKTPYKLIDDPRLVAEIADVAGLYVGGGDTDLRAARVRARAIKWLAERGLTVARALAA